MKEERNVKFVISVVSPEKNKCVIMISKLTGIILYFTSNPFNVPRRDL